MLYTYMYFKLVCNAVIIVYTLYMYSWSLDPVPYLHVHIYTPVCVCVFVSLDGGGGSFSSFLFFASAYFHAYTLHILLCRLGGAWCKELREGMGEAWELHYLAVVLEGTQGNVIYTLGV